MSSTREHRQKMYEGLIGHTIAGRYVVQGLLGFGGMGAVYEALQTNMNRPVALKLLPATNPTAVSRFNREALTVSKLSHPNTVTVYDYGTAEDGQLFLSMEYLRGHSLNEVITHEAPMDPRRVVHIASQACRSLGEAHRLGIIHRDVKPDNIMLIDVDGDADFVKVLDFGIAKAVQDEDEPGLTGDGRIVGTPRYMSPEQIMAGQVDARSDIYSLGCILFEMLCGAPPFQQSTSTALMISHAQDPPPSFAERLGPEQARHMPVALEHVIRRALAKRPSERQQSMDQLREELETALHSASAGAPLSTQAHRSFQAPGASLLEAGEGSEPVKRGLVTLYATIGVLVVLISSAVAWILTHRAGAHASEEAAELPAQAAPAQAVARLAAVVLSSTPSGATVYHGERPIGVTPLSLYADEVPNTPTVRLEYAGHAPQVVAVAYDPSAREPRRVEVTLVAVVGAAEAGSAAPSAPAPIAGDAIAAPPPAPQQAKPAGRVGRPGGASGAGRTTPGRPGMDAVPRAIERSPLPAKKPESRPQIDRLEDDDKPRVDRL